MTDTHAGATILRVREPGDLIEAIPYLLGFHPRESLVVVGLDDGRVCVTARVDLSELTDAGVLASTVRIMRDSGATHVLAVIYEAPATVVERHALPRREVVGALADCVDAAGADLVDALLVVDRRWWSYACDEDCCPPEGREIPGDASPAAAAATYAGLVALSDRDELRAALDPDDDATRALLEPLLVEQEHAVVAAVLSGRPERRQRSVKRAIFAAAREADESLFLGGSGVLSDEQVCRFAVALGETPVRDSLWLAVDQRRLDGRVLWREIARRVPSPYDAAPLFLFGWASWRDGDGVSASIAVERALSSDPGYTAAELLGGALMHGLDPRRTPRLRMPRSA
jgi:Domain of unknown function (DUF4192)